MCCGSVRRVMWWFIEACDTVCVLACVCVFFFFFATYLLCSMLTAGSVPHAERGDGEDRHPAHQGQRKPHQGSGVAADRH